MTDVIIALIPDYGLFILFGVVLLACLAVPLPSSVLVLTSGAFAATGDLLLWAVVLVAFSAFVMGDQIAFWLAGLFGPKITGWARGKPRVVPVLEKSEKMLDEKGRVAVFLSHTVLSPTCPYVSYLCGAGGMKWADFSGVATIGAALWVSVYVGLGYTFAAQIAQVASILSQFFGFVIAAIALVLGVRWLRHRWHNHVAAEEAAAKVA